VSKPDWKYAPEWANYLAKDRDGLWCWHENYVIPEGGIWMSKGRGRVAIAYQPDEAWRETLEERPNA
jgi:hypothetical protein